MAVEPGEGTTYPPLGHWSLRSRCFIIGVNPDKFFEDPVPQDCKDACAECPVQVECLEYAIAYKPRGFWAGTTERQRWRLRTVARRQMNLSPPRVICPGCRSTDTIRAAGGGLECLGCGQVWPAV